MKDWTAEKIVFQGVIRSVQSRSNVWRYRLDNRTHFMTGYNNFLIGVANDTGVISLLQFLRNNMKRFAVILAMKSGGQP